MFIRKIFLSLFLCMLLLSGCTDSGSEDSIVKLYQTVSFDANGGIGKMEPLFVPQGSTVKLEKNTYEKQGYTFTGWSLISDGPVIYIDEDEVKVNGDITLYAVWVSDEQVRTVTFDANGGKGTMEPLEAEAGTEITLPKNEYSKANSTFTGWASTRDSIVEYLDGATIAVNDNMTLYAQWVLNEEKSTVIFDANGGTGRMESITGELGSKMTLPKNEFIRSGYSFTGWAASAGAEKIYNDQSTIDLNKQEIKLYAVWKQNETGNTVTYTFHSNNGKSESFTREYKKMDRVQLPFNEFINSKYFLGWSINPKATEPDEYYTDGAFVFADNSLELYAVWSDSAYKLSFEAGADDVTGAMKSLYVKEGFTLYLPDSSFERYNYEFRGWQLKGGSVLDRYNAGVQYKMPNKDVTLVANWIIEDPSIGGAQEDFKGQRLAVQGVTLPDESEFRKSEGDYNYIADWKKEYKIYNINQHQTNYCWAAVDSNMLHWWLDVNKENIEKYGKYNGPTKYNYQEHGSDIFEHFKQHWPNIGNSPKQGLYWFFYGRTDRGGGAFFKDLFLTDDGDPIPDLVEVLTMNVYRKNFNETLGKLFREGCIAEVNDSGHSVTLWGAQFDNEGYISHLYTNNSGDVGYITKSAIKYDKNGVYRSTISNDIWHQIFDITIFCNGKEYWDKYFKNNPK